MKSAIFIIYFLLMVTLHHVAATLKCNCKKAKCVEPNGCKAGVRPDMCNCCKVCAKEEGQLCAGPNYVEGQCGDNLQCMVRHVRSHKNKMKTRINELVGKCEHIRCHYKRCPFGKSCKMINGAPTCVCPDCINTIKKPVCGVRNNKEYLSECELRKDECETGREIGLIESACVDKNVSSVTCGKDSMRIEILKSYLGTRHRKLSLLESDCTMKENATHIFFDTKLNQCGTKVTYTLTSVVYSNVVRSYTDPKSMIIRRKNIQIPFECDYSLRSRNRIKISTRGEFGDKIIERLSANGVGIRIREVNSRRKYRSLNNGGLKVDINPLEKYIVELKPKSFSKTNIYPKVCYVTPVVMTQRWMKYTLIEDGCPVENGVEILQAKSPIIRLSVPGIKFRGARYPGVLVRCKLQYCHAQTESLGCRKQCPPVNAGRGKRDVNKRLLARIARGKPYVLS